MSIVYAQPTTDCQGAFIELLRTEAQPSAEVAARGSEAPQGAEAPAGGALGIYAKLPSIPGQRTASSASLYRAIAPAKERLIHPEDLVAQRLERWALQSVARSTIPQSRTAACQRCRVSGAVEVAVKYSRSRNRASYANLQTCGSVWTCPVCSTKVSEHRRNELGTLVRKHQEAGGQVLLITRTFPHKLTHTLAELMARLKVAEERYKSGAAWQSVARGFGFVGSVRAVECTFGANGWHPHIHELVFLAPGKELDSEGQESLRARLYLRWANAAVRAGFEAPSEEHGLDVRDGEHAAAYVSKWGLESELTKWHVKRSKGASFSPFDLLRVALHDDDAKAVKASRTLFQEYAEAFHGKRQLVWSKGLRAMYDLGPELTDEEAAEGEEPDAILLGMLSPGQWKSILRTGMRGHLLEAINDARGDWYSVAEILGEALAYEGKAIKPRHHCKLTPEAVINSGRRS